MAGISPEQARSRAAPRARIDEAFDKYGVITEHEIGLMLDPGADRPERVARERHRNGDLICVPTKTGCLYPCFQIRDGIPHRVIGEMRRLAGQNGWTDYDLFMWLIRPEPRLEGEPIPAEMVADPTHEPELLRVLAIACDRDSQPG